MTEKKKVSVILSRERDTKNKVLFRDKGQKDLDTAYPSQDAVKKLGNPDKIRVTIEAA
jgi:hypothetical protein